MKEELKKELDRKSNEFVVNVWMNKMKETLESRGYHDEAGDAENMRMVLKAIVEKDYMKCAAFLGMEYKANRLMFEVYTKIKLPPSDARTVRFLQEYCAKSYIECFQKEAEIKQSKLDEELEDKRREEYEIKMNFHGFMNGRIGLDKANALRTMQAMKILPDERGNNARQKIKDFIEAVVLSGDCQPSMIEGDKVGFKDNDYRIYTRRGHDFLYAVTVSKIVYEYAIYIMMCKDRVRQENDFMNRRNAK